MTDRYQDFVSSSLGQLLVKNLGLPNPVTLDRYVAGSPLVDGTVVVGGAGRLVEHAARHPRRRSASRPSTTAEADTRYRGLVFDATGLTDPDRLVALRDFFAPLMRSLETLRPAGRARHSAGAGRPARSGSPSARSRASPAASARRSAAAAPSSWSTSPPGAEGAIALDPGVPAVPEVGVRLRAGGADRHPGTRKPAERRRTGSARWPARSPSSPAPPAASASRSPGCSHRDGATVVGVDVPQAAERPDHADQGARRRLPHPRHHRQGRPEADRPAPHHGPRRRRRRGAQRRHHPRQAAGQHGRGPLELGPRRQPRRARADHRRAARPGASSTTTAGSSASPRSPASPATSARPTTPPPRPA